MAKLGTAYVLPDRSVVYRQEDPLDEARARQVSDAFQAFEAGRAFGPMHLVIGPEIEVVLVDVDHDQDTPVDTKALLARLLALGVDPSDWRVIARALEAARS